MIRSFFKKRASVYEIGRSLFALAKNEVTDQLDLDALQKLTTRDAEATAQLLFELLMLRLFAVEFAVYCYVKEPRTAKAILDVHYNHFRECAAKAGDQEELLAELTPRLVDYGNAASRPHPNGAAWQVGKTFAERSGSAGSAICTSVGAGMFFATLAGVRAILGRVKIVDA